MIKWPGNCCESAKIFIGRCANFLLLLNCYIYVRFVRGKCYCNKVSRSGMTTNEWRCEIDERRKWRETEVRAIEQFSVIKLMVKRLLCLYISFANELCLVEIATILKDGRRTLDSDLAIFNCKNVWIYFQFSQMRSNNVRPPFSLLCQTTRNNTKNEFHIVCSHQMVSPLLFSAQTTAISCVHTSCFFITRRLSWTTEIRLFWVENQ